MTFIALAAQTHYSRHQIPSHTRPTASFARTALASSSIVFMHPCPQRGRIAMPKAGAQAGPDYNIVVNKCRTNDLKNGENQKILDIQIAESCSRHLQLGATK